MNARPSNLVLALWALGVGFAACSFPDVTITPGGEGGASTSAGPGTGGSLSGECRDPVVDCKTPSDPCLVAVCEGEACGEPVPRGEGEPCNDEGWTCVEGACVECAETDDCTSSDVCIQGRCVPGTCQDDQTNGDETDENCGGPMCPPCMVDKACEAGSDCVTGLCVGSICTECLNDADCEPTGSGFYCDEASGTCVEKLTVGVSCVNDNDCQSGHCPEPDFVCCDVSCGAKCEACLKGKTGVDTGTCAPVIEGTDPDNECPLLSGGCGGSITPCL